MKKLLSTYTIASNCTDITDVKDGIREIEEYTRKLIQEGKNVPSYFASRIKKLEVKLKKYQVTEQLKLSVNIRFSIDQETLKMAIAHCLYFKIEVTKPLLIKEIKEKVYHKGISLIDFPENWGDDISEVVSKRWDEVQQLLCKYAPQFGINYIMITKI